MSIQWAPITATTATTAISIEFRRDTGSASGGGGGGGRSLGSRVVGALAGGVGLLRGIGRRSAGGAGGGGGVAGRRGERVGDRRLLEEDDDLEAGRRALAARPDGRAAGGAAAAVRGRRVGLLGLGEAHAGDALHVAQAGHHAGHARLGLGAGGELEGGRADRAADARAAGRAATADRALE